MQQYQGKQPNILFIMADQWRYDYAGFMGADFVATPNLDRLAARGQVFEQCACNSPLCSPSRISLATGLNPERTGALDNSAYLPRHATTYYQRLRDAGYEVGCVGKLDLAKHAGYNGSRGQRPATYLWGFTDQIGRAHV
jgi:arylsulfatase